MIMCVRNTVAIWCAIAVCLIKESSSFCEPFNKTSGLAQLCGYPATANFTHGVHFKGSVASLKRVALHMSKCSKYAGLIACSVYAPRCESHIKGPYLPCKTVCDEFERACGDKIFTMGMEWIIGMCQLLPQKDDPNTKLGYLGRCFEPPGFKTPLTAAKPLKCYNLIVPICQQIGFTRTVLSETKQKDYLTWATNKINSHHSDDISCSLPRKRFFCMENFPPCVDNRIGFYCRPKCQEFFQKNCTSPFSFGQDMCMELPEGTADNDLCVQNHWPRAENWPHVRNPQLVTAVLPTKEVIQGGGVVGTLNPSSPAVLPTKEVIHGGGVVGTLNPSSPVSGSDDYEDKQKSNSGVQVAPVVGGVLAGVCVIALALGIAYLIYRNQKRRAAKHPYPYDREILYNDERVELAFITSKPVLVGYKEGRNSN